MVSGLTITIIGHGFETLLVFENCIPWVRHSSGCLREFFGYIIDCFEKDCLLRILIINVQRVQGTTECHCG
jgi:hypothetical protein